MPLVDTFSRIRSKLESKNVPKCFPDPNALQDERVLARNHDTFVTERPLKSYTDYKRRARHRFTGYDSLAHVPYRPFAGLKHTDPYRLIEDALGISLEQADIHQSFSDSVKECAKSSSFTNQHTIRVVRDCSRKKSQVLSKTAGLSAIQLHLGSTSRAMREIAAGAAYHDTIPRERERRSFISDMRAPKPLKREKSTSSDSHCVYNPSIYLPTLVHTASSKACLTSQRPAQPNLQRKQSDDKDNLERKFLNSSELPEQEVREEAQCPRVGPNIYVAVAAAQFKLHFSHHGKKKEISCAKKLQMRKCLIKMKSIYSILCCLYNMKVKDLKNKHPLSMASIKQMSVNLLPNKESTHYPAHRFGTHQHTYNTHTPSYLHQHKNTGHHIETWEDLMLVARSPGHHTNDTTSPLTAASGTCLEPHQKIARVLPPWQRQVVFVDNCENNANDPAVVIAECIAGFQSAKDQISVQTKSLLHQRQKSISHLLGVKARELKLTAIVESCLQDMREKAYCISRSERANEKNRPAWFGELEKEVSSAFESSTRNQQSLERATRDLLEMMKSFLYSDVHNIPRVMEKFCLLVMSIPSDLLCLTPVIAAVQFVLEHILEVPARLCQQWLEMRGLPATGIALTTQPVIVFGLTV